VDFLSQIVSDSRPRPWWRQRLAAPFPESGEAPQEVFAETSLVTSLGEESAPRRTSGRVSRPRGTVELWPPESASAAASGPPDQEDEEPRSKAPPVSGNRAAGMELAANGQRTVPALPARSHGEEGEKAGPPLIDALSAEGSAPEVDVSDAGSLRQNEVAAKAASSGRIATGEEHPVSVVSPSRVVSPKEHPDTGETPGVDRFLPGGWPAVGSAFEKTPSPDPVRPAAISGGEPAATLQRQTRRIVHAAAPEAGRPVRQGAVAGAEVAGGRSPGKPDRAPVPATADRERISYLPRLSPAEPAAGGQPDRAPVTATAGPERTSYLPRLSPAEPAAGGQLAAPAGAGVIPGRPRPEKVETSGATDRNDRSGDRSAGAAVARPATAPMAVLPVTASRGGAPPGARSRPPAAPESSPSAEPGRSPPRQAVPAVAPRPRVSESAPPEVHIGQVEVVVTAQEPEAPRPAPRRSGASPGPPPRLYLRSI